MTLIMISIRILEESTLQSLVHSFETWKLDFAIKPNGFTINLTIMIINYLKMKNRTTERLIAS